MSWSAFTSASLDPAVAVNMALANGDGRNWTVFMMDVRRACSIQQYSFFEGESEVVLEPNIMLESWGIQNECYMVPYYVYKHLHSSACREGVLGGF